MQRRKLSQARIGYVPYSRDMSSPGDRRRFAHYARRRGLTTCSAEPSDDLDLAFLSTTADITRWCEAPEPPALVYEVIDSYFALPRRGWRNHARGLLKRVSGETRQLALDYRGAMEEMCRRANSVVCTTAEQRASILPMCPNVHVILDYHGNDVSSYKTDYRLTGSPRIMWEGLPYTLGAFKTIRSVVRELQDERGVDLHLVTDRHFRQYAGRFRRRSTAKIADRLFASYELHEWSPRALEAVATSSDAAIIPADLDDPFSAGKPENKLLLLWRMGLPVVTAATPAYKRAMAEVETPWLACRTPEEWRNALERLIEDQDAREAAGQVGRAYVEANYSEERLLSQWDALFESVGFES